MAGFRRLASQLRAVCVCRRRRGRRRAGALVRPAGAALRPSPQSARQVDDRPSRSRTPATWKPVIVMHRGRMRFRTRRAGCAASMIWTICPVTGSSPQHGPQPGCLRVTGLRHGYRDPPPRPRQMITATPTTKISTLDADTYRPRRSTVRGKGDEVSAYRDVESSAVSHGRRCRGRSGSILTAPSPRPTSVVLASAEKMMGSSLVVRRPTWTSPTATAAPQ
jgi:hypothetical protein